MMLRLRTTTRKLPIAVTTAMLCCVFTFGCRTRCDYRRAADCEVGQVVRAMQCDPRWVLPARPVEPDRRSRMADLCCPDCGPLPPDDPAAHCFMEFPDGFAGWPYWTDCGEITRIEFPSWRQYLPVDDAGVVKLSRETSIELALLNSRQYQDQIDQLYFTALAFTLERFEFATQWFYRSGQSFGASGTGGPPFESRLLSTTRNAGFTQNFPIGTQLLVDFANSFVWEFAGDTLSSASSGILVSLTQPLLRGAFRQVRLEGLTQAERNLLYDVRTFARFRREFFVNIVGNGYLPLLAAAQAIKNQENNLESLARNLQEHEQLARAGLVAPIQVDQVFQQYQQGRLNLLSTKQALQSALDGFKLSLGLPPQLAMDLDEEALRPFELNDPEIEALQDANEELRLGLIQIDETPSVEEIKRQYAKLKIEQEKMIEIKNQVEQEFKLWSERLKSADVESATEDDRERLRRERALADRLKQALEEVDELVEENVRRVTAGADGQWIPPKIPDDDADADADETGNGKSRDETTPAGADDQSGADARRGVRLFRLIGWQDDDESLPAAIRLGDDDTNPQGQAVTPQNNSTADDADRADDTDDEDANDPEILREKLWVSLKTIVGRSYRKQLADLFVIQTQIRVYLIESTATEIDEEAAIQTALSCRLDLMNARGNVVDAYRRVEVAADALEADLDLQLEANLATDPNRINPVRFDASANRYRVGLEFDSPITRLVERNVYRAAQIEYQQARRAYMAVKDTIVADVRQDIRQVVFNEFSFEIAKLQLLTAARQVDEAQLNLRNATEPDSSFTRNLLEALQGLLASKNNLIQSWVSYEASRMALFRDIGTMQIAPDGSWINESADESADQSSADRLDDAADRLDTAEFEREYIDGPADTGPADTGPNDARPEDPAPAAPGPSDGAASGDANAKPRSEGRFRQPDAFSAPIARLRVWDQPSSYPFTATP